MWTRLLKRGTLHLHLWKGTCMPALKKPNEQHMYHWYLDVLEYATAVWYPYRQNQVEKLEAIQSRTVRFMTHDYSYNTSMSKLKKSQSLGLLSERRKSHRLHIFYKSVYNNIVLPIPPYYQLSIRETRNYSTNSFIQPSVHHDYYKYSFFSRTIRDWNCLLPETRSLNYSAFCSSKLVYS